MELLTRNTKTDINAWFMSVMAAEPGFEPGMNESESLVLPLHHSAMSSPKVPSALLIIPTISSRCGCYADASGTPRHCKSKRRGRLPRSETITPIYKARVYKSKRNAHHRMNDSGGINWDRTNDLYDVNVAL